MKVAGRALLLPLAHVLLALLAFELASDAFNILIPHLIGSPVSKTLVEIRRGLAITLSLLFVNVLVARKPLKKTCLALSHAGQHLLAGILLGALLMGTIILVMMLAGWYRISLNQTMPFATLTDTGIWTLGNVIFQEGFDRGLIFPLLEAWLGTWVAVLADVLFFGLVHLSNLGTTLPQALSIGVGFGLLATGAYLVTRKLWFPIGLHWSWNFIQGPIFGLSVSGQKQSSSVFHVATSGPDYLTGGAFGPEAGLVAIVMTTSIGFFLLAIASNGDSISRPAWLPCEAAKANI